MLRAILKRLHRPVYQSRQRALVRAILPALRARDQVLDVGCGFGQLGRALMDSPDSPEGVVVRGLERAVRGDELIEVDAYEGGKMPYASETFDVVLLADVLHHEENEDQLIAECARVSRRLIIIKDHRIAGPLARQRISLIDWAANAPYGVPCLYCYHTVEGWRTLRERHSLKLEREETAMNLYPPLVNLLFGRRLQYLAVLRVPEDE